MRVKIEFTLKDSPWGGGNQFLNGLKQHLTDEGKYTSLTCEADIILFDSFHDINKVLLAKKLNPQAFFIHRINGPISGYRGWGKNIDYLIHSLTKHIADGVIFQSKYSKNENLKLGIKCPEHITVVHNAARPIFFEIQRQLKPTQKTKVIAISWSSNINKGFDYFKELDASLDFSKFEFVFIGNAPFKFRNIKSLPPMDSVSLSKVLANQDIYITGSKNDSCSNSVLEALAVGLPVVAHRSGGTPELVGKAGEYFADTSEAIIALNKVANDLEKYQKRINVRMMSNACEEYKKFFEHVLESLGTPKTLGKYGLLEIYFWKFVKIIFQILDKIMRSIGIRT